MATEAKYQATRQGGGTAAYNLVSKLITFTITANATLSDSSVVLPAGSIFHSINIETPAAVAGTPTTCNVRFGSAAAGQQIVADVDAKAAGHIAATIVTAFDKIGFAATADTTLYGQCVIAGGTGPTGTIYAYVNYAAPAF